MSISRRTDLRAPQRPEARELPRLLEPPGTIEDLRQEAKVRHPIAQAALLAVAAAAGNAGTRVDIELRGKAFAGVLGEPPHIGRIPSHDAARHGARRPRGAREDVPGVARHDGFRGGDARIAQGPEAAGHRRKDAPGQRRTRKEKVRIESAFDPLRGVCLGQMAVEEKSNETAAVPKILALPDLHGYVVASDATSAQGGIARQIREQGGEHVPALKGS